jgi:hypothetical protein
MQLSKVLSFWHLQGDIYYQKKVKQKQSQTKIMHKIFLKRKITSVPQKD